MKKTLMVLDGNSLLYRAFFAMPPFTSKDGQPSGAVYGFFAMLMSAIEQYSPEALVVAFDLKGKTFRHDMFDDYKAKRKPMPDDLIPQFPILKKALEDIGIKTLEVEGYEADDILGAMAKKAALSDMDSILVTSDKDILQLVDDTCTVLLTKKGLSETVLVDRDKLNEMYGLRPDQIVDLKGFMGDTSDNIPGVPGVGEKTALKLLSDYKTMEGVYENIDSITGKLKDKLIENKDLAFMSKTLSTIDPELDIDVTFDEISFQGLTEEFTKPVFEKLGFNSLIKRLGYEKTPEHNISVIKIDNMNSLIDLIDKAKSSKAIALHFEDDIYLSFSEEEEFQIVCEHTLLNIDFTRDIVLGVLAPVLEDPKMGKVMFASKNASHMLSNSDIKLNGVVFDVNIAQYVINPADANANLSRLIEKYNLSGYCAAMLTIRNLQEERLKADGLWYVFNNIEMPLISVLLGMENTGFRIDASLLSEFSEKLGKEIEELTTGIYKTSGYDDFNINSPQQLGQVLFERLGLPVLKKTKTGYATSNDILEKLYDKHPVIDLVMRYRQLTKLKSTYIDGFKEIADDQGFVHTTFVQASTITGRISSKEPNLQNIPIRTAEGREIRKMFLPSDNSRKLITSDYSQIELRILASISDDIVMKQAFTDGIDIHTRTASEIFEVPLDKVTESLRRDAKAVNFGIVYGISDFGLAKNMNISVKKASVYISKYFERFSGVKRYMDEIKLKAKADGYVTTMLGRRRYLPELKSSNFNIRSFGERAALNTPIQGTAADIIKLAMIDVYNKLRDGGYNSKLILQVHDELIIDTAADEIQAVRLLLKECMENAYHLDVPLLCDVGIGDNWLEAK